MLSVVTKITIGVARVVRGAMRAVGAWLGRGQPGMSVQGLVSVTPPSATEAAALRGSSTPPSPPAPSSTPAALAPPAAAAPSPPAPSSGSGAKETPPAVRLEVLAHGEPETLVRGCVGCGLMTGSYCDLCFAEVRVPTERWAARQMTPLCSTCDNAYGRCHDCRGLTWCTPPPWRNTCPQTWYSYD